jgi:hypothetical protein
VWRNNENMVNRQVSRLKVCNGQCEPNAVQTFHRDTLAANAMRALLYTYAIHGVRPPAFTHVGEEEDEEEE